VEGDTKKAAEEIGTFAKEKTLRLRNESHRKILAEGFLEKQADGSFKIGDCELPVGAEIEIKMEEVWVKLQVELDGEGQYYVVNTTCAFQPIKAYVRYWGKSSGY
jgi:hypothetical protein